MTTRGLERSLDEDSPTKQKIQYLSLQGIKSL